MTLVTWHRSELTEEFGKLRRDLPPSLLNSLVLAGLVPADEGKAGPARFSALAIVPILQAQASSQPLEDERLPREARPFLEMQRGVQAAAALCILRVEQTLVRSASLGALASMLTQWDASTLESLRGDARLEWRLTELLVWLRSEAASVVTVGAAAGSPQPRALVGNAPGSSGWSAPSVPALLPVYGLATPARPAPAVTASFAERLARISAAVGKPVPVSLESSGPPEGGAMPIPVVTEGAPPPKPTPALPRPLPKRQSVGRAVSDELDWGLEQIDASASPMGPVTQTPVVDAPGEALPSASEGPLSETVAQDAPAMLSQDAPALIVQESSGLHPAVLLELDRAAAAFTRDSDVSEVLGTSAWLPPSSEREAVGTAGWLPPSSERESVGTAGWLPPSSERESVGTAGWLPPSSERESVGTASWLPPSSEREAVGTASWLPPSSEREVVGTAAPSGVSPDQVVGRAPSFQIAPELYEDTETGSPAVQAEPSSGAEVTESVWSESDVHADGQVPARWEMAVDAVRRLAKRDEQGPLSYETEALAANAIAACLTCEVFEVEPDLLQLADDATIAIVELVWTELEPELSNADRAELAVRFGERLSRRRGTVDRVSLREQLVGICRLLLRDPALAYDLLTDRFTAVDLTAEECNLISDLADDTANQLHWAELLERSAAARPELATLFSGYRLDVLERMGDLTGVADALERMLTETTDTLTYLAILRRTMVIVENDLGDLHRAAELARNAIASGRFDDQLLGEADRIFAEAWRFEELSNLLLDAVASQPVGSVILNAVLRRAYYLARDHFSDAHQASSTMLRLLIDPRHDAGLMLSKVVLPEEYDPARREAEALREFAIARPTDAVTPSLQLRAAHLFAGVLNDDDAAAKQVMEALPRLGADADLIHSAEQVMFALTRSADYGADAVGWLLGRAHAFEDKAATLALLVGLMQLPSDAAISDEARAEIWEDALALADSPELPAAGRASAHLAVARLKRGAGAVRTAAYHAVQAAEQAADEDVDEEIFADALGELGDLGGSTLRAWGGDEVSARALFSNNLAVLLNFGRLCSQAGAWPQAVRAFERAVPLLRATEDAAGLADVQQQLDAARQQLPQ